MSAAPSPPMRAKARPPSDEFDITQTSIDPVDDGQLFDAEEMLAIREQYEERLQAERDKREELEWQVRMALAQLRDAELDARRAADQMHKLHGVLAALVADSAEAPLSGPSPSVPAPQVKPVVTARKPLLPPPVSSRSAAKLAPPPIPSPAKNGAPSRPLDGYRRLTVA